jgi:beta-lactamase regulating signal transducer with metallopeptidase domain
MNRITAPLFAALTVSLPALLDSAAKGAVFLAVIGFLVLFMRKTSAATRHLAWLLGIVGLILLPLFSAALPGWRVLPAWASMPRPEHASIERTDVESVLPSETLRRTTVATSSLRVAPSSSVIATDSLRPLTSFDQRLSAAETPPTKIDQWIGTVWFAGATFLLLRIAAGALLLRRSVRHAVSVTNGPLRQALDAACDDLDIRRHVHLLLDHRRIVPLVWGIFRPRLILPAEASSWDDSRLRAVLLHELAHIKRGDLLVMLLTHVACALHWFNPLVWLAGWRMHMERERACDDLVLTAGIKASDYAEHLLHVATQLNTASPAGALAMARPSRLEGRLLCVLNQKLHRGGVSRSVTVLALVLVLGVIIPMAMLRAQEDTAKKDQPRETETTEAVPNPTADASPIESAASSDAQPSDAKAAPEDKGKLPILGDIPLLDKLFQPGAQTEVLTLKEDGSALWNTTAVSREELSEKLRARAKAKTDGAIVIRAEQKVPYKEVVQVLDVCRAAGLENLSVEVVSERNQSLHQTVRNQDAQLAVVRAKAEEARLLASGLGEEHPLVRAVRAQIAYHEKSIASEQSANKAAQEVARARLSQAEVELKKATELTKQKLISAADLDRARTELEVRKAELAGDKSGVAAVRLRRAENQLQRAEELYKAKLFSAAELERAKFEVELRKAEAANDHQGAAKAKVRDAEAQLKRAAELQTQNLISTSEFDARRNELEIAQAELKQTTSSPPKKSTSAASAEILQLLDEDLRLAEKKLAIMREEEAVGITTALPALRMQAELIGLRRAKAAHEGKHAEVERLFDEQIKTLEELHRAVSSSEGDGNRQKTAIDIQREILALKREKVGTSLGALGKDRPGM